MAEKKDAKKPPESNDGPIYVVIGFFLLLVVLGGWLKGAGILDMDGEGAGISSLISSGDVQEGKDILNKGVTDVRIAVGSGIIGQQAKRAAGTVVRGPLERGEDRWWFVNYETEPDGWVNEESITVNKTSLRLLNIFPILYESIKPIGIFFTLLFFIAILFIGSKSRKLEKFEKDKKALEQELEEREVGKSRPVSNLAYAPINLPTGNPPKTIEQAKNSKWQKVEKLMTSANPSEWREAIMEADIVLDEMLTKIGYDGPSIGDKLKQIERSDFITLGEAWEAHKVRNNIAHRGSDYVINRKEAERVIALYKKVFSEFYYI